MDIAPEIRKLNQAVLFLAHKCALSKPELATMLFGVSSHVAKLLEEITVDQLHCLSNSNVPLVTLRSGQDIIYWENRISLPCDTRESSVKVTDAHSLLKLTDYLANE